MLGPAMVPRCRLTDPATDLALDSTTATEESLVGLHSEHLPRTVVACTITRPQVLVECASPSLSEVPKGASLAGEAVPTPFNSSA